MPCSTTSGMPMLGCCGAGGGGIRGQFQSIVVRKYIPEEPSIAPFAWLFDDIDGFIAEAYAILDSEPYPGIWSSATEITIGYDGAYNKVVSPSPFFTNSVSATAGFHLLNTNAVGPIPPRGSERIVQTGNDSYVSVSKVLVKLLAPWGSYLTADAVQTGDPHNECIFTPAGGLFELDITCAGQSTSSVRTLWFNGPYVDGSRRRVAFETSVNPC